MDKALSQDCILCLRTAVETTFGQKVILPKDFVQLSEDIFKRTHQNVAVNTLKRIWGNIDERVQPRFSTLTILARYTGAESWDAFCEQAAARDDARTTPPSDMTSAPGNEPTVPSGEDGLMGGVNTAVVASTQEAVPTKRSVFSFSPFIIVMLLATVVIGSFLYMHSYRQKIGELQDSLQVIYEDKYILHCGQTFSSYASYLRLFSIGEVEEYPYYQTHPAHPWLIIWGPEYHHPHWHNDGDSALLMPTITERWAPADTIPELITMCNSDNYYNGRRHNEIRLTFMKNLHGDSLFTFLGAYRFSMTQSDTTKRVWERVADQCDLRKLDELIKLRN